jgi:hypothetical protein
VVPGHVDNVGEVCSLLCRLWNTLKLPYTMLLLGTWPAVLTQYY